MDNVDIIGVNNVAEFIKNGGFTKFSIERPGSSKGAIPVFDLIDNESNSTAIEEFKKWAHVVNGNNAYKIILFNDVDIETDEAGNKVTRKSKKKNNKAEIYFKLNNEQPGNSPAAVQFNRDAIINEALDQFRKEQEIKELKERIAELEQEEEEEGIEDENLNNLGGLNLNNIMQVINGIKMMTSNQNPLQTAKEPVLNGTQEDKIKNINSAVKRLAAVDPELDTDLLKLAHIAETNKPMFDMLLNTLRQME